MEVEMNKKLFFVLTALFLGFNFSITAYANPSLPKQKQTTLGLYITAKDAFVKWHADPGSIKIIDVRTPGEYIFVGHAPMASNIPLTFLKNTVDPKTMKPVMPVNKNFISDVKKKCKETDTIMVMCRSGGRSAAAVNNLAKAGFTTVYNITDGFEGDTLQVPGSYNNGKRVVNGWKNAGAPWTYKLDPELVYLP